MGRRWRRRWHDGRGRRHALGGQGPVMREERQGRAGWVGTTGAAAGASQGGALRAHPARQRDGRGVAAAAAAATYELAAGDMHHRGRRVRARGGCGEVERWLGAAGAAAPPAAPPHGLPRVPCCMQGAAGGLSAARRRARGRDESGRFSPRGARPAAARCGAAGARRAARPLCERFPLTWGWVGPLKGSGGADRA
jgi:hypothetical protein